MGRQGGIAEGPQARDLRAAPRGDRQRLVGPLEFHFGDHQGSVLGAEHIQHPIATREFESVADTDVVRQRGWAENINESELGVASVAAPIRNGLGDVVASISVAGPLQRLEGDSLRRFARPCVDAGLAISRRLGYRGGPAS